MIPLDKQDAVDRGLREAFGTTTIDAITAHTEGHTPSLVYRIVVSGTPYLLKIITRAEDQTRHYANMSRAATGELAPTVVYASVPDKVAITNYVSKRPLSSDDARVRLPDVLRSLHALPASG